MAAFLDTQNWNTQAVDIVKIANSLNGNLLLKSKQNNQLLAIQTPSFLTTYEIDDFNRRDTTSKIRIDETNTPESVRTLSSGLMTLDICKKWNNKETSVAKNVLLYSYD